MGPEDKMQLGLWGPTKRLGAGLDIARWKDLGMSQGNKAKGLIYLSSKGRHVLLILREKRPSNTVAPIL